MTTSPTAHGLTGAGPHTVTGLHEQRAALPTRQHAHPCPAHAAPLQLPTALHVISLSPDPEPSGSTFIVPQQGHRTRHICVGGIFVGRICKRYGKDAKTAADPQPAAALYACRRPILLPSLTPTWLTRFAYDGAGSECLVREEEVELCTHIGGSPCAHLQHLHHLRNLLVPTCYSPPQHPPAPVAQPLLHAP